MAYWMFSPEALPNDKLFGKPGYTPEFLMHAGVSLGQIKSGEWVKLPEGYSNIRHADWRDKKGTEDYVPASRIVKALDARFKSRGVVFIDHEPSREERITLEKQAHDINLVYRMSCVEQYEAQVREREVTGHGRTQPTPYEDQCYSVLGLTKPYSVEAMRAQRHPGEAVGEQIVAALERLEQRRAAESHKPDVTKGE